MKSVRVSIALIIIVSSACKNQMTIWEKKFKNESFIQDVPTFDNSNGQIVKGLVRLSTLANLDSLQNGFDGLELRFWNFKSFSNELPVIILKNVKGEWVGSYCKLNRKFNQFGDSTLSVERSCNDFVPKNGWDELTNKLFSLNVLTLPDFSKIDNYELANDGHTIEVEVASKKIYRVYRYHEPEMNYKIQEAKDISKIIELLRSEAGIKSSDF